MRPLDWRDSLKPSIIISALLAILLFNPLVIFIFVVGNSFSHQFDQGGGVYDTFAELTAFFLAGFFLLDVPVLLIMHRRRERTGTYKVPPALVIAFCVFAIPALHLWQVYSNEARQYNQEQGRKAGMQRDYEAMKARVRDPSAILTLPSADFSDGQARALGERLSQKDVTAEELHAALSTHFSEEIEFGVASNPNADSSDLVKIAKQPSGPPSVRVELAVANNPHTPGDVRRTLLGPAYSSCDPQYLYSLWSFHSNEPGVLRGLAENPCTPVYPHVMLRFSPNKEIRDAAIASEERRQKNSKEEKYSADWNPPNPKFQ